MAVPTRLQITWQDENTLKVQTDAGMQTAALPFRCLEGAKRRGYVAGAFCRRVGTSTRIAAAGDTGARFPGLGGKRRTAAVRVAQSRDDASTSWLLAQRTACRYSGERGADGVLGSGHRAKRRPVDQDSPVGWTISGYLRTSVDSQPCPSEKSPGGAKMGSPRRRVRRDSQLGNHQHLRVEELDH